VSNSWGGPEDGSESAYDSRYLNHPGVVITAATGDNGYPAGVIYPATSPYTVAVGGTSLTTATSSRGWSETAWTNTGSGCSSDEAGPAFQSGITGCATRATSDVSAVADPNTGVAVYQTYGGAGWTVYGGTSAATPVIAAVYALAGRPAAADTPAAYPYRHPSALFDVTGGTNGSCTPQALCTAATGWDGPTGLGTPNGTGAFTSANTVTVTNPGNQATTIGTATSVQLHASDTGAGQTLSWTASGLPPGLSLNASTGLISGTATTTGTYSITATATDTSTATAGTRFTWPVTATTAGAFVGLTPTRVLDTRAGIGAPKAALAAGADLSVQITGRAGIPTTGVASVAVNVTVLSPTKSGWVGVWSGTTPRPVMSTQNFLAGYPVANLVITTLSPTGRITIHNGSAGTIQLLTETAGYHHAGTPTSAGTFVGLTPTRVLDTRAGIGAPKAALAAGADLSVQITGRAGIPTTGVASVAVNVTVLSPTKSGWVGVWSGTTPRPVMSTQNFLAGYPVANLVITTLSPTGRITIHNGSAGTIQLLTETAGYHHA